MKNTFTIVIILLHGLSASAQASKPAARPAITYVKCGSLFDGKSDQLHRNVTIVVEGEKIRDPAASAPAGANTIDLGSQTCLPGLIDVHTHALLQGDITAEDYDAQLLKQSTAYRAIVGTQ